MHDKTKETDEEPEAAGGEAEPREGAAEPATESEDSAEEQEQAGPEDGIDDAPEDAPGDAEDAGPTPEEQIAELKDQLLRALAEVENVRRRAERERADTSKYAVTGFARDVLGVADNLQRTLVAGTPGNDAGGLKALLDAVEMTQRDLAATLERHGIRAITPLGEKFDHNFHQAMFEVPGSGKEPGTVVEVMQTGYMIADRLLRPAMVGVAKAGEAEDAEREDTEGEAPADGVDTEA